VGFPQEKRVAEIKMDIKMERNLRPEFECEEKSMEKILSKGRF
jgi:hypothetical protein